MEETTLFIIFLSFNEYTNHVTVALMQEPILCKIHVPKLFSEVCIPFSETFNNYVFVVTVSSSWSLHMCMADKLMCSIGHLKLIFIESLFGQQSPDWRKGRLVKYKNGVEALLSALNPRMMFKPRERKYLGRSLRQSFMCYILYWEDLIHYFLDLPSFGQNYA